jgi:Protein of unknown function (DUF1214)
VTITLPNAGQRFISLQVIDEDHYTPEVIYGAGSHTFTREKIGTRYVTLGVRILVDPADPQDVKQVHALQDTILVTQPGGAGRYEVPNWDQASQKKVRDALLALAETLPDTKRTFGARGQVDPVRHLIGTAFAFGGNPEKDALYLNVTPSKNDGITVHRLNVKNVPVDGFWSVSLYNAEGYYQPNQYNAYSLNNITAKKKRRRFGRHPVRRLRWQDSKLPTDHERLELHGATLSSARRNLEQHVEIPGGAGGELSGLTDTSRRPGVPLNLHIHNLIRRKWCANLGFGTPSYFGAGAPSGGTTFMTNDVGFSFAPNGPGTLFFTGGRLRR